MLLVPLFKVRNMAAALRHYTEVLDFVMTCPGDTEVVDSDIKTELQLTIYESDLLFGSAVNVLVDDADTLFAKYKSRGLQTDKPGSPVHQEPVDQTWRRREFYVSDADGNTLRFCQPI